MIRVATEQDVPELNQLFEMQFNESQFPELGYTYITEKVDVLIKSVLSMTDKAVIFVYESKGQIKGAFAAIITESLFSDMKQSQELAFFVTKECRGSRIALKLLKAYTTWAQAMNADQIMLDNSTTPDPEVIGRFYEKMGYIKTGGTYRYSPEGI